MADLHKAEAAAREALADYDAKDWQGFAESAGMCAARLRDLLAALDAARGQAVKGAVLARDGGVVLIQRGSEDEYCRERGAARLYASPPAALAVPAPLHANDVQWIVNDIAELGVMIRGQAFFLYKGESLVYEDPTHEDDGRPMMFRPVFKREFGECCRPINYRDPSRFGTVSLDDSDDWKPLPPAQQAQPAAAARYEHIAVSVVPKDTLVMYVDGVERHRGPLGDEGVTVEARLAAPPAAAVPAENVTPMRQPRADLARLVESINAAVYANGDGLSVTEAIGALELAKLELLKEQEQ